MFSISSDGLPILYNIDNSVMPNEYVTSMISRFTMRNLTTTITIEQLGHTFVKGNFLYVTTGNMYALYTSQTSSDKSIVGVVTEVGIPNVNHFTFRPFGKYLSKNDMPNVLGGGKGTYYWLDAFGDVTTVENVSQAPVYLQITDEGDAIMLISTNAVGGGGGGVGPTGPSGVSTVRRWKYTLSTINTIIHGNLSDITNGLMLNVYDLDGDSSDWFNLVKSLYTIHSLYFHLQTLLLLHYYFQTLNTFHYYYSLLSSLQTPYYSH